MRKNSCTDCQYYKNKETVVDGYEIVCDGMMRVPKYKVIEHHCTKHPITFKRWWNANKNKTNDNIDDVPRCFLLHESLRPLEEMIGLAKEIIERIKK